MAKLISRLMRSMIAYVQRNDLSQTLSDGEGDACAIAPEMPALCRAAAAEGAVLLKNDGALPIRAGETVALFGRCASDYFYVGYGSGGDVVKPYAVSLTEGLRQNGIKLNERLLAADLAPKNWTSYNVRKKKKRLTKELKEDGKKELHSRADHRQAAGSRTALQPGQNDCRGL